MLGRLGWNVDGNESDRWVRKDCVLGGCGLLVLHPEFLSIQNRLSITNPPVMVYITTYSPYNLCYWVSCSRLYKMPKNKGFFDNLSICCVCNTLGGTSAFVSHHSHHPPHTTPPHLSLPISHLSPFSIFILISSNISNYITLS